MLMYKYEILKKVDHTHLVEYLANSLRYGPVSFGATERDSVCIGGRNITTCKISRGYFFLVVSYNGISEVYSDYKNMELFIKKYNPYTPYGMNNNYYSI